MMKKEREDKLAGIRWKYKTMKNTLKSTQQNGDNVNHQNCPPIYYSNHLITHFIEDNINLNNVNNNNNINNNWSSK